MNLKKIFSIRNENYRKIITILGIKIQLKKDIENEKLDELLFQLNLLNKTFNDYKVTNSKKINDTFNKIDLQKKYLQTLVCASNLHQKVFPKYKNINQGKDVVLVATGPSLLEFQPIANAVYVGVNKAFTFNRLNFDYLFLQDYSGATKTYVEEFCNYKARKFLGFIPDYIWNGCNECIIPDKYSNYENVERYYITHPDFNMKFIFDIANLPLTDSYSIVFPAMQFILWTNPKRIYLVGCDCTLNGYNDSKDKNNLAVNEVIEGWKKMKEFAKIYYPDTEIISINPVGLKGIFNDTYQKNIVYK